MLADLFFAGDCTTCLAVVFVFDVVDFAADFFVITFDAVGFFLAVVVFAVVFGAADFFVTEFFVTVFSAVSFR